MSNSLLNKAVEDLRRGRGVAADDAEPVLDALISETEEPVIAKFFSEWHRKGIEEDEIYNFAKILRRRMKRITSRHETFVDIVGTGGSKSKSFNISTAASFVVAGAGLAVAKHGNKAATSNSGSADVLAELGVDFAPPSETAERSLNEIGICFMFAPNHHRLSPILGKVRRELGFPTIFNCVGPLCNPASAPYRLIGVWDEKMLPKIAGALARLGTQRSWIVHGKDGSDEISIAEATIVTEVAGEKIETFEISPGEHFDKPSSPGSFKVADAKASSEIVRAVLGNRMGKTSSENAVVMNAAAALYLAGSVENLTEGIATAIEGIRAGRASKKLAELSEYCKR